MTASGREKLRSSLFPSKLCVEHSVSESEMNLGGKKRKVSFPTPVEMGTENPEALSEPVVMKKKRTTGNAHSFKAKYKGKHKDEIVPVELALGQTEKHTSYQEKEKVHSVNSQEGCLKRMYKHGSLNTIYSGRDHLVAGKNINQEASNVNEPRSPSSSLRLKSLKRKVVKDSAEEEHNEIQILSQQKQEVNDKGAESQINCFEKDSSEEEHTENQILSQQRQAVQDKGAGNEINSSGKHSAKEERYDKQILSEQKQAVKDKDAGSDLCRLLYKLQKRCRRRMTKLIQKQQEQSQHLHQIWEKKRSDLEREYKLEQSVIRSVYGEDTIKTNNKLKLLDVKFAEKMKEHNRLKDVELKKLETEQLSAVNEESQKETRWLAACCSDEPMADHGPESLGLHSEEAGCEVPLGNSSNHLSTYPQNELGVTFSQAVLAGVELADQPKYLCLGQISLPASRGSVPGEIGAVELNKEVPPEVPETVPDEIGHYVNPLELSNSTSNKGIDKGDAIGSLDALVNLGDENDVAVGLLFVEQIMEPSEQTKASWTQHHCTSSLQQALEDQLPCSSNSDVIQDIGVRVVEAQNTSPYEVDVLQSNIQLQDQEVPATETQITAEIATTGITDTVTPEESIAKSPVLEDQYTRQIENTDLELIGAVNPVQDQSAQEVEKQIASPFEPIVELHDQDASDTSWGDVANLDTIGIVREEFSENFQDQDASVLEDQATSQVEVANSEPVDTVNPVHSSVGAPAIQNCEELVSVDVSPCHNQPPSIEVETQSQTLERSSSQTAEIADSVVVSCESASQIRGNWEPQSKHLDIGSESQDNLESNSYPNLEIMDTALLSSASTSQLCGNQELPNNHFSMGSESQVNVDVSQMVVNTVEPSHQAVMQLGSADNLHGSSNPFSNRQVTSLSSPPLYAAMLGKINKEIEQLQKNYEVKKSQLKSDHEMEIRENLAEIKNKYYMKFQAAETELSYKKNVLEKNRSKVLVNMLLAESFSSTCEDFCWL